MGVHVRCCSTYMAHAGVAAAACVLHLVAYHVCTISGMCVLHVIYDTI